MRADMQEGELHEGHAMLGVHAGSAGKLGGHEE
jgi:hypothetical protein